MVEPNFQMRNADCGMCAFKFLCGNCKIEIGCRDASCLTPLPGRIEYLKVEKRPCCDCIQPCEEAQLIIKKGSNA